MACKCDTMICSHLFRVRRKLKGKWRCEACKTARKLMLLQGKKSCMCVHVQTKDVAMCLNNACVQFPRLGGMP